MCNCMHLLLKESRIHDVCECFKIKQKKNVVLSCVKDVTTVTELDLDINVS